jgi:mRNA-degrading endonuclease RelE of RelBE toxin-antitoxin system
MKVTIEPQPRDFIRGQPPETRKSIRAIIHSIERGESVPERLEDELDGFYKIKVEGYRLVVQYVAGEAGPFYRVVFIERRAVVYEMFKQLAGLE